MSDVSKARKGKMDNFSNVAFGTVTMSAANTLTFAAIQMAVGLFQGIAMLLNRIKYYPTAAVLRELVASTDNVDMAITSSNRLSSIQDQSDPAIIDLKRLISVGVAVEPWTLPIVSDFSSLPGGGKLVSANPMFVAMQGNGMAAAGVLRVQLDFTFITLSDADYLELIQAQFPVNIS